MKKILIIGSTGMLGKTLLLYLKEKKYDVLRLDRNEYDAKNTNINLLRNVLEKKCCDVVEAFESHY